MHKDNAVLGLWSKLVFIAAGAALIISLIIQMLVPISADAQSSPASDPTIPTRTPIPTLDQQNYLPIILKE